MSTTLAAMLIGVSSAVIAGLFGVALEMKLPWRLILTVALTTFGIAIMKGVGN